MMELGPCFWYIEVQSTLNNNKKQQRKKTMTRQGDTEKRERALRLSFCDPLFVSSSVAAPCYESTTRPSLHLNNLNKSIAPLFFYPDLEYSKQRPDEITHRIFQLR